MLPIGYATGGVTWVYLCGKRDGGVLTSRGYVLIALPQEFTINRNREPEPRERREDYLDAGYICDSWGFLEIEGILMYSDP